MRMTGIGSLGFSSELIRRAMNGESERTVSYRTPTPTAPAAQPVSYPTGQTVTPQGDVITVPATPEQRQSPPVLTQLPGGIPVGSDVILKTGTPGQRGGITQAPSVLRPGPSAKPGEASPATTVYGAGSTYYGAPEGGGGGAAPAAPAPARGALPIAGLILWALFGT